MDSAQILALLHLSDPGLPVGGYAHSYGMETCVQQGIITDFESARRFIEMMLTYNLRFTDAALLSLAYDAASLRDSTEIGMLDDTCNAVKLPMEIRQASERMGLRLWKIFSDQFDGAYLSQNPPQHYPVVFGVCACGLDIPKAAAISGFFYNALAGMVTNAVKLVPLGQQQGQELLFSLQPMLAIISAASLNPDRDMIGFSSAAFDIRSMQHERLYSRLYMS